MGTYFGIPLRLHWSFVLILVFVLYVGLKNNREMSEIGVTFILVLVMFVCVVFHEYGHALMAKRFNVRTVDIILSPIGGLARLERLPKNPLHEFYIALAGPMVNLVISIFLGMVLFLFGKPILPDLEMNINDVNHWAVYLSLVVAINVVLFVFNLIPAFPMDGGRILRSLLAIKIGKKRSTDIAAFIGYFIAIGFIIWSFLYEQYTLGIIGVFVMIMARNERISAKQEDFLSTKTGKDILPANNRLIPGDMPIGSLMKMYQEKEGYNFLVMHPVDTGQVLGVISETFLKSMKPDPTNPHPVADFVSTTYPSTEDKTLYGLLNLMKNLNSDFVVINREEGVPALLDKFQIFHALKNI